MMPSMHPVLCVMLLCEMCAGCPFLEPASLEYKAALLPNIMGALIATVSLNLFVDITYAQGGCSVVPRNRLPRA